ncbi:decarboxylating 6-phosphogluconate dehydrogenase [soil metagenome]
MKLVFLGLGKMGTRMVEKLLHDGHEVVVWNRTEEISREFALVVNTSSLTVATSIEEAVGSVDAPKIVWSMLPAGPPTETALSDVKAYLESGDIVIDGANSRFSDTERRFKEFSEKGVKFLGIGVSGGVIAEKNGYPMMVGGDKKAYATITPLLDSLSKPSGGHTYFGTGGAGHFVKMVHNGIEYGMMQAIGEGFGVLEKAPYELDLVAIAKNWQKGSIVDSFLIDRAKGALEKDARLENIIGEIDATGEAEWTVDQGKKEEVPVENIEQSLDFRRRSKIDPAIRDSFAARMVAALRQEFGGHKVKAKQ